MLLPRRQALLGAGLLGAAPTTSRPASSASLTPPKPPVAQNTQLTADIYDVVLVADDDSRDAVPGRKAVTVAAACTLQRLGPSSYKLRGPAAQVTYNVHALCGMAALQRQQFEAASDRTTAGGDGPFFTSSTNGCYNRPCARHVQPQHTVSGLQLRVACSRVGIVVYVHHAGHSDQRFTRKHTTAGSKLVAGARSCQICCCLTAQMEGGLHCSLLTIAR
jgi:hypothetical protein